MTFEQMIEDLVDKTKIHWTWIARGTQGEISDSRATLEAAKKAIVDAYYGNWTHYEDQTLDESEDYEVVSLDGRSRDMIRPAKWSGVAGFVNPSSEKRMSGVEWFRVKRKERMPSYD